MRERCTTGCLVLAILGLNPAVMAAEKTEAKSARAQAPPSPTSLAIFPEEATLSGADSSQRLLVSGVIAGSDKGRFWDYSRAALYTSSDPKVATVTADGVVLPRHNGTVSIRAVVGGRSATAQVTVKDFDVECRVSFRNQVVPVFTKLGCNAGGCHGKATGQNGFKLSLLGFDRILITTP
jgi:hypothetical protein